MLKRCSPYSITYNKFDPVEVLRREIFKAGRIIVTKKNRLKRLSEVNYNNVKENQNPNHSLKKNKISSLGNHSFSMADSNTDNSSQSPVIILSAPISSLSAVSSQHTPTQVGFIDDQSRTSTKVADKKKKDSSRASPRLATLYEKIQEEKEAKENAEKNNHHQRVVSTLGLSHSSSKQIIPVVKITGTNNVSDNSNHEDSGNSNRKDDGYGDDDDDDNNNNNNINDEYEPYSEESNSEEDFDDEEENNKRYFFKFFCY
jgi:hypothetical protein